MAISSYIWKTKAMKNLQAERSGRPIKPPLTAAALDHRWVLPVTTLCMLPLAQWALTSTWVWSKSCPREDDGTHRAEQKAAHAAVPSPGLPLGPPAASSQQLLRHLLHHSHDCPRQDTRCVLFWRDLQGIKRALAVWNLRLGCSDEVSPEADQRSTLWTKTRALIHCRTLNCQEMLLRLSSPSCETKDIHPVMAS